MNSIEYVTTRLETMIQQGSRFCSFIRRKGDEYGYRQTDRGLRVGRV